MVKKAKSGFYRWLQIIGLSLICGCALTGLFAIHVYQDRTAYDLETQAKYDASPLTPDYRGWPASFYDISDWNHYGLNCSAITLYGVQCPLHGHRTNLAWLEFDIAA